MPPGPTAAEITVRETLELLDGPLSSVASAIARDQYAFWLGSGISLGRVDGLQKLIPRVLEHLQQLVRPGDLACRFRATLGEIMQLATLTPAEQAATDVERPINEWPTLPTLVGRLVSNYARFLDLGVQGEEADYLLWVGVNVPDTYANPVTEPDSEHICLAILVLEGVASDMPSANWDGLIERAANALTQNNSPIVVCVLPEDLRLPEQQAKLYKFHGCAVKAGQDEAAFRSKLVARQSQINGWVTQPDNRPILNRLVDIATTKHTLMLGLSAQDGNIQNIFAEAEAAMPWGWPADPPAYAFCENQLGFDQRILLQIVYRAAYTAATRDAIYASALIRAYAKPFLAALVLHVMFSKLEGLVALAPGVLPENERASLIVGLRYLRTLIGAAASPNKAGTVLLAIRHYARFMALFHEGTFESAALRYRPVTARPIQNLATDPNVPTSAMRELAIALGLLGEGVHEGSWSIESVDPASSTDGAFRVISGARGSKLFVVANTTSGTRLILNGHINDGDDAIIIHGLDIAPLMARSPRPIRSRTGVPGIREVSIVSLLAEATTGTVLMQRFREELSI
jgi:SIR2-like domain